MRRGLARVHLWHMMHENDAPTSARRTPMHHKASGSAAARRTVVRSRLAVSARLNRAAGAPRSTIAGSVHGCYPGARCAQCALSVALVRCELCCDSMEQWEWEGAAARGVLQREQRQKLQPLRLHTAAAHLILRECTCAHRRTLLPLLLLSALPLSVAPSPPHRGSLTVRTLRTYARCSIAASLPACASRSLSAHCDHQ